MKSIRRKWKRSTQLIWINWFLFRNLRRSCEISDVIFSKERAWSTTTTLGKTRGIFHYCQFSLQTSKRHKVWLFWVENKWKCRFDGNWMHIKPSKDMKCIVGRHTLPTKWITDYRMKNRIQMKFYTLFRHMRVCEWEWACIFRPNWRQKLNKKSD